MSIYGHSSGYYRPLSVKEVERIHHTSLRILEEVGFMVDNQFALDLLEEYGCEVDQENRIVRVDRNLLLRTIKKAPARIGLCGRDDENEVFIEANRTFFSNGGTAVKMMDLDDGERRDAVLNDLAQICKIIDVLNNIHVVHLPVYPHDVDQKHVDIHRFFNALNNNTKHIMGGVYSLEGAREVIRVARILNGDVDLTTKTIVSFITCLISPLKIEHNYVRIMYEAAQAGVPVITSVCSIAGLTTPITLAGQIAQLNAEALSGVFLLQAFKPGSPVFYSVVPTIADMQSMQFLFGAVESGLMNAALSQLATFYNLPMYSTGGVTDSKTSDIQAGFEKGMGNLMPSLAGAQLIHNSAGLLDGSMVFSLEELIIDDEINGMALRATRSIEVEEETLAFETIKDVGPGGNFVTHPHTFRHMRTENFIPRVAERSSYMGWLQKGGWTSTGKANKLAREILEEHQPTPISDEKLAQIEAEFPHLTQIKI